MTIRTFIALPIDEVIRSNIGDMIGVLRQSGADVKWVKSENLHLTLKFLGSIDGTLVEPVSAALSSVGSGHLPFSFRLTGIGTFPDLRRPRVIWVGISGYEEIIRVFKSIDASLASLGFERERRPLSPHVTIGRVRTLRGIDKLAPELVKYNGTEFGVQRATAIHFMESMLRSGGPEYRMLHEAPLKEE